MKLANDDNHALIVESATKFIIFLFDQRLVASMSVNTSVFDVGHENVQHASLLNG